MSQIEAAITNFVICRPQFTSSQENLFAWLIAAHTKAEALKRGLEQDAQELELFRKELQERLWHVGCKPGIISERGHVIPDFFNENWREMQIYRLEESLQGLGMQERQVIHHQAVDHFFEKLYQQEKDPPQDFIHVSCTGYASPSGAQKIVSKNRWEGHTNVTHLYHMGCYAALPAIRMANAFVNQSVSRVDIVHTELCSLHMNPAIHAASQLVSQSLFADGCIKYSLVPEKLMANLGNSYLKILGSYEYIIPNSTKFMEWIMGNWGFNFVLAKEIPVLIARALKDYLEALSRKVGLNDAKEIIDHAIFAIHPGGPKILDYIQKGFEIEDWQIQASRNVLKKYGNMSSATLPHIWEAVCADPKVTNGTKVLCMGFGPGLTIAGALLEKVG